MKTPILQQVLYLNSLRQLKGRLCFFPEWDNRWPHNALQDPELSSTHHLWNSKISSMAQFHASPSNTGLAPLCPKRQGQARAKGYVFSGKINEDHVLVKLISKKHVPSRCRPTSWFNSRFREYHQGAFPLCSPCWNLHRLQKVQIAALHNITWCSDNPTYTQAKFKGHYCGKIMAREWKCLKHKFHRCFLISNLTLWNRGKIACEFNKIYKCRIHFLGTK